MRVVPAHQVDPGTALFARGEAHRDPRRNAVVPEQQGHRPGEVLAVAGVGVEQEGRVWGRVLAWWRAERVLVGPPQVSLDPQRDVVRVGSVADYLLIERV